MKQDTIVPGVQTGFRVSLGIFKTPQVQPPAKAVPSVASRIKGPKLNVLSAQLVYFKMQAAQSNATLVIPGLTPGQMDKALAKYAMQGTSAWEDLIALPVQPENSNRTTTLSAVVIAAPACTRGQGVKLLANIVQQDIIARGVPTGFCVRLENTRAHTVLFSATIAAVGCIQELRDRHAAKLA